MGAGELSGSCRDVVEELPDSCRGVVGELSQSYRRVVGELSEVGGRVFGGCRQVVVKLSEKPPTTLNGRFSKSEERHLWDIILNHV